MRIILIIAFLIANALNADNTLKKVSLQLSWFDQFQFAGYYMAKEKGFYIESGLDVDIKSFQFDLDTVRDVSVGKIDFAIGRETLILDKSKYKNLVTLYALFQSSPLVLLSKKSSGIDSIEKFANKNIMTTIDDAGEVSLKSMITSNKIDLKNLNFLEHTHNINDLIDNNTDIMSAYISKSPFLLDSLNIDYNIFAPADYGFDMYSDFLYTSQHLIDKELGTVNNFKYASLKGWEYAYSHIQETVDVIMKKYNSQNLLTEELVYEAIELKKLSYLNNEKLGDIKKSKLQRIHDLYNIMGLLPEKVNIDNFVYDSKMFYSQLSEEEKEFINQNPVITVGQKVNFKPLNFLNDIGLHHGISHDILKIVSEKTGLRFISDIDTNENLITKLKSNKIDILSKPLITKNNDFIRTDAYFSLTKSTFIKKGTDIKDINTIGYFEYTTNNDRLGEIISRYPNAKVFRFKDINKYIEHLLIGTVDLLVIPQELFLSHVKPTQIHNILELSDENESSKTSIGFVLQKDSKILYRILSKALDDISYSQLESINHKWIPVVLESEVNYKSIIQISIIILSIVLFLLYRHRMLRKVNEKLEYLVNKKTKEITKINKNLENKIKEEVQKSKDIEEKLFHAEKINVIAEMIENIAHQWRQPLSVISTGVSNFKFNATLNKEIPKDKMIKDAELILTQTTYLSNTINDFSDFFSLNNAVVRKHKMQNIFYKLENLISENNKEDIIQINSTLNCYEDALVNEDVLLRVFFNIFDNSKYVMQNDYTKNENKYFFIELTKIDNNAVIYFKDNGGGIPDDIIKKVFEPYFTTKHASIGTGLGLYMTYQVITNYLKGSIEVSTVEYKHNDEIYTGAEFKIIIPLCQN